MLIEANPRNFWKLQRSGRNAKFVHSAVGAQEDGTTRMTVDGDMTAGEFGAMSPEYLKRWGRGNGAAANRSVEVPCSSLKSILHRAGYTSIDFLSLDVEGAEDRVFRTVEASMFGVVMGSKAIVSERRTRRDGEVELVFRSQNEFLKLYVNRTALLKVPGRAVALGDGQVINPMQKKLHNVMKLWLK